jgi:hypothetical protein
VLPADSADRVNFLGEKCTRYEGETGPLLAASNEDHLEASTQKLSTYSRLVNKGKMKSEHESS